MGTLVFHHNGIGDYVMSLPALRLICAAAPAPVDLVCGDGPARFLYKELAIRHLFALRFFPGRFAHEFDPHGLVLEERYEVFISLVTWPSANTEILARRSRAPLTLGFFSSFILRMDAEGLHDIARLFALALPFAPAETLESYAGPIGTLATAPSWRAVHRPPQLLVVHPDTRPEKMWPLERYDAVLEALLQARRHLVVALLNLPPDRIPRAVATGRCVCVRDLDLAAACRLVAEADFFLGVDSCMLHVADIQRVPGVALFGPTRPDQFGYWLTPSATRENLWAPQGLAQLPVEHVIRALERVMGPGS